MDDTTTSHQPDPNDINPHVAYEHADADMLVISRYAIALVVGVLIAAAAMWGLFDYFGRTVNSEEAAVPQEILDAHRKLPPVDAIYPAPTVNGQPGLQTFPKRYIKDLRALETAQLNSYGWVDQKNGIVRIPIDAAIDAVAAKGLPSRPVKGDEGLDAEGYWQIPSASSSGRTPERIK
jgi:hypothetical protein